MKKITFWLCIAATLAVLSCENESETICSNYYAYSPDELEAIDELISDYGVSLDYKKESSLPLPTVEDMEELCIIAAEIQGEMVREQRGDTIFFRKKKNRHARRIGPAPERTITVYNGSYSGSGTGVDSVATGFAYSIDWNHVKPGDKKSGNVTCTVYPPTCTGSWTYDNYSFSYYLNVTFDFTITCKFYKTVIDEKGDLNWIYFNISTSESVDKGFPEEIYEN